MLLYPATRAEAVHSAMMIQPSPPTSKTDRCLLFVKFRCQIFRCGIGKLQVLVHPPPVGPCNQFNKIFGTNKETQNLTSFIIAFIRGRQSFLSAFSPTAYSPSTLCMLTEQLFRHPDVCTWEIAFGLQTSLLTSHNLVLADGSSQIFLYLYSGERTSLTALVTSNLSVVKVLEAVLHE